MSILAIEEAGKASILRGLLVEGDDQGRAKAWRDYRRHTAKNFMAGFLRYARNDVKLEDLRPLIANDAMHRDVETLKQRAFYSDCLTADRWIVPDEVVDADTARVFLTTASIAVGGEEGGPMASPQELQLWVKHLGPVWGGSIQEMKQALAACYREAAALGVLRGPSKPAEMSEFLDLGAESEDG